MPTLIATFNAAGAVVAGRPWAAPVTTATFTVPGTIPHTGAADAAAQLNTFLGTVPDGSIIDFAIPGAIYRMDQGWHFYARNNLVVEGHGNTTITMNTVDGEANTPFHLRGSNHIAFNNFTVHGSYSTYPGQAGEESHCLSLSGWFGGRESSFVEMGGVTGDHFFGDFVYLEGENVATQRPSHDVWIHNNSFDFCGRNAVSPINVTDVLVEANSFDHMAYHCFDCEPNFDIEEVRRVKFKSNTVGSFAARSGLLGQFFSCFSPHNAPIDTITVTGNTVAGIAADGVTGLPRALHTTVMGEATHRYTNIVFTNNFTSRTVAGSGVLYAQNTDGITFTGNTQPLSSGTLVQTSGCTAAVTSPNP